VLAGLVGGGLELLDSGDFWGAVVEGFFWGASSFAAWATARELDHDDPRAAGLAAVLAPVALFAFGRPALLAVFGLMLGGRIALRSTGLRPSLVDQFVVVGLGVWAASTTGGWAVAMLMAVLLVREAGRTDYPATAGRFTGFALASLATVRHGLFGSAWEIPGGDWTWPLVLTGVAVLALAISDRRAPSVPCDFREDPPRASDQFVSRLVVGVGAIALILLDTDPAAAAPAVAALVGVAVFDRAPERTP
jgi:hypothetical protein